MSAASLQVTKRPNEKGIGGTAIMIKREWANNILQTSRYSHRCVEITLHTGMQNEKLHIINKYVPHMGYRRGESDNYWTKIKQNLTEIPQNDIIWATDNNGQIARRENHMGGGEMLANDAHIVPWRYAKGIEKGEGEKPINILREFELSATITMRPPQKEDKQRLVTWTSGDGQTGKQIDYIVIINDVKNWLNYSRAGGTANTNIAIQHHILCMEIRLKFKNNPPLYN